MKIAKSVVGGMLMSALSLNALGVVVGPYNIPDNNVASKVTSFSGAGMDNGTDFVDPLTATELTDTNAGTFLATNIANGYNGVTVTMGFNGVSVGNGLGADMVLFFLFDQTANNVGISTGGSQVVPLSFFDVSNPPQQVVNNVQWDGQTLNNVELMAAEVDLGDLGVNSLNEFTLSMAQTTDIGVVAFSMAGALYTTEAVVPVPAAVWLFGSGLLGLAGVARKRG